MKDEDLANVMEALENLREWKPVYKALLRVCRTKDEAIEALKYLIKVGKK